MAEQLFDDGPERPPGGEDARHRWAERSRRSLADELRRRKRRLENRNPLDDRAAYLSAFRVVADLEAHLRERGPDAADGGPPREPPAG